MDFKHGGNVYKVAREKNIAIEDIIDFSANINPFGLSKKGELALKESWSGLLNYPDPDYVALKNELASFHKCLSSQVFLGNGAIDMIFFMTRALKPKKALVLAPTFVEYERALNAVGSHVEFYYLEEEKDFQLDLEAFLGQINGHDCIVLCNPNNPTGQLIPKETIMKVLDFTKRKKINVLLDEAFMDFTDDEMAETAIGLIGEYNQLFILRSITKFFAVPGLRIGYLITDNEEFAFFYQGNKEPWSINYFAETYTIHALADKDYIDSTKSYMQKERVNFYEALSKLPYLHVYKSQGNYLFFKYTGSLDLKVLLEDYGVLIRSCSNYRGLDTSYFRVAVKEKALNQKLIKMIERVHHENDL